MVIGIMDSGKGGLAVLAEAIKAGLSERYVFYADNRNAPYGGKSAEELFALTMRGCEIMRKMGANAVIIACNTATTAALNKLRLLADYPIFGVRPPVVEAVARPLLVTGTEGTIERVRRDYTKGGVLLCPLPKLAGLIEKGGDAKTLRSYLRENLPNGGYKGVVLGCTHYALCRELFTELYPDAVIYEGGELLIRKLVKLFNRLIGKTDAEVEIIFSGADKTAEYAETLARLLN